MADHTSFKLRLLHLSDLHERGSLERESWRRRRVLGNAWLRNLDELRASGPFDLVCFTGDAANWGLANEYAAATEFFRETLQRLGVLPERFFLVPGNHDVCRKIAEDDWKTLRANFHQLKNQEDISRWLAGGATPWGFQDAQRNAVLTRQDAYRDWLRNDLKRPDLLPNPNLHPHLGYRQAVRLPGFPFDVHVIGLDSAWLAGDGHDAGKLRLTEDQAMRLTGDARGEALDGFRLALIHHPLDDLADGAHCRRLLAERVDLLLRGHLHEPEPAEWADPDRRLRQIAAGCLYEGHGADRYPNACEVIQITLDAQGRPLRYELWFRGWSDQGFWFDDNGLYRETQNGRLTWGAQAQREHGDVHPRVEDVFAGRQAELQQLEQVLLRANGGTRTVAVCSVQGMAGVGKSYLVDRFYAQHRANFAGGYLRLTLDPRQPLDANTLLGRLQDLLQLPTSNGGDAVLCSRLKQPLTLVHIENADSRETARVVAQAMQRLADCPVAVSGRFQGLGESANWSQVSLQPFEENAALDQLSQELGQTATAKDYGELVRALGYLPLAIHLAAGHLRAGRSVAGFLDLLRRRGLCLEHPDPADPNRLLSITFKLSLDLLLDQLSTDADRLLPAFHALSHGPTAGFGASLGAALAGLSAADFEELAVQAHTLSLLDRTPEGESWRLHPLLAELLRPHAEETAVLERMTGWFLEHPPEGETSQEDEQRRLWSEIHREDMALIEWLARVPEEYWSSVERAGSRYAMHNDPFGAWLDFCERALRHDPSDDKKSHILKSQSHILWTASNVAMSAGLLDRALAMARQKAALDRSRGKEKEAALAQGKIADVLQARGELDEALRIRREEELPVYERLGDVRARAVTLGNIADVLQARGELDEALRIRREEQLPVYERLGDVRARAVTLGYIADVLQARGELDEALRIYQKEQLPVYERLGDVRARAVTLGYMADVLQARGELDEALRIRREEELPVYERLGDVRARAVTLGRIADVLQARGEWDETLRIRREEQLPVYERLGDVRARTVTLGKIADVLQARGELDEALRIRREEELPVYERLGDVRARAVTLGRIADVLQARGQWDEALRIRREEELPVYERLGDVRARAVTLGNIADVLQARGQWDEALRIRREEELPVYERLGDVRARAVTLGNIADVLQARGQWDEALRIRREEQLPVYERLGDVRAQALTLGRIADVLQARGEWDEALRIRREEELPVYERLGDVRARAVTLGNIADVLQARGEWDETLRIRREEQLPVYERLGDVRELLVCRAKIGLNYLARGAAGDRQKALELLKLALQDAQRLQLPEAQQIAEIIRQVENPSESARRDG